MAIVPIQPSNGKSTASTRSIQALCFSLPKDEFATIRAYYSFTNDARQVSARPDAIDGLTPLRTRMVISRLSNAMACIIVGSETRFAELFLFGCG